MSLSGEKWVIFTSLKVKYPMLIGCVVDWRYWFRHALTATLNLQFTTQKYHQICHTCPFSVGRIGRPSPIFQNHPGSPRFCPQRSRSPSWLKTEIIIRMDQNGTLINQPNWSFFGSETNHFWGLIILTHVHCPSKLVRHSSVMEFHLTIWWFNSCSLYLIVLGQL
jgi:hypothetical protein